MSNNLMYISICKGWGKRTLEDLRNELVGCLPLIAGAPECGNSNAADKVVYTYFATQILRVTFP